MSRRRKRQSDTRYVNVPINVWDTLRLRGVPSPDPSASALYVYLVTCPETLRIPGVVRAGKAALAEALSWEPEAFAGAFTMLEGAKLAVADWSARLVYLPEPLTWDVSRPTSTGPAVCWRREMANIPPCKLSKRIDADVRALLAKLESPVFLASYQEDKRVDQLARAGSAERDRDLDDENAVADAVADAVVAETTLPTVELDGSLPRKLDGNVPGSQTNGSAPTRGAKKIAPSPDELAALAALNDARTRVIAGARPLKPTSTNLKYITERLREHSIEDLQHVIAVCEAEVKADPDQAQWFDAVTPFRPDNFARKLARQPGAVQPGNRDKRRRQQLPVVKGLDFSKPPSRRGGQIPVVTNVESGWKPKQQVDDGIGPQVETSEEIGKADSLSDATEAARKL
jgi:hypothetical protein